MEKVIPADRVSMAVQGIDDFVLEKAVLSELEKQEILTALQRKAGELCIVTAAFAVTVYALVNVAFCITVSNHRVVT